MIAKQLEEIAEIMGAEHFEIVEFGGSNGKLCRDILSAIKLNDALYSKVHYYIIDKRLFNDEAILFEFPGKMTRLLSPSGLSNITGCIISNELVDNIPFRRVVMQQQLKEVFVTASPGGRLCEILMDADQGLNGYFKQAKMRLSSNHETEIPTGAASWMEDVSKMLLRGFVMTIDYGYTKVDSGYGFSGGTMTCYSNHIRSRNPYDNIGHQDITADVNFSFLKDKGEEEGLTFTGYTSQSYFLRSLAAAGCINGNQAGGKLVVQNHTELLRLCAGFLNKMSSRFRVLVQQRNVRRCNLRGLQVPLPV
jgi:SAM-dependent MidA family methyltransferase